MNWFKRSKEKRLQLLAKQIEDRYSHLLSIANICEVDDLKNQIKELADDIKYSKIIDCNEAVRIDKKIENEMFDIKQFLYMKKYDRVQNCIERLSVLIKERNKF